MLQPFGISLDLLIMWLGKKTNMKKLLPPLTWLSGATFFLLMSLVTFSIKKPTLFWYQTNSNDLFLLISAFFLVIAVIRKELVISLNRKIHIGFLLGFIILFIATGTGYIMTGTVAFDTAREYARIIAAVLVFFEIIIIGNHHRKFITPALIAIGSSSVILPLIFFITTMGTVFFIDGSETRFEGLFYDPNYFAAFQIVPTFLLAWVTITQFFKKRIGVSIIGFFLFSYSIAAIIWSGSRGGILGLGSGFLILGLFLIRYYSWKKNLIAFLMIGFALILCPIILPLTAHNNIRSRFGFMLDNQTVDRNTQRLSQSYAKEISDKKPIVANIVAKQGRGIIWRVSLQEIVRNPLGYGPGYGNVAMIIEPGRNERRVAHNTLLQILLTGGIGLLGLISYGLFFLLNKSITLANDTNEIPYLVSALIGTMTAGLFIDSLWSRWIWAIAGLLTVLILRNKKHP